jgi:hypothetical protein
MIAVSAALPAAGFATADFAGEGFAAAGFATAGFAAAGFATAGFAAAGAGAAAGEPSAWLPAAARKPNAQRNFRNTGSLPSAAQADRKKVTPDRYAACISRACSPENGGENFSGRQRAQSRCMLRFPHAASPTALRRGAE